MKFNIQNILVAPLDWGLGHATRCIAVVKVLQQLGYTIFIACNDVQQKLLEQELKQVIFLPLKGYNIRYSKHKYLLPFKVLAQIPKIVQSIYRENKWLSQTIATYHIDLVISDNRFGLFSKKVPCIFITHQLQIKAPFSWLEQLLQLINYHYIHKFDACWIPDFAIEPSLAGTLSHPTKMPLVPVHYIGPLSRLTYEAATNEYDICIVLSGPEPQRTMLEKLILKDIYALGERILFIRGLPQIKDTLPSTKNITIVNHLTGTDLQRALASSNFVISRSGYTTVMEVLALQKKALLIPTPGQTEQEYLGKKLMEQQWSYTVFQSHFNLKGSVKQMQLFPHNLPTVTNSDLKMNISNALKQLTNKQHFKNEA